MKPCTLGKRHKWEFVRNRVVTYKNARSTVLSMRGLYRCACGETKLGNFK